jgi:hypothetical protein
MKKHQPTIRDLYPDLTEEESVKAEENMERYLELVLRIFERLESEGRLSELEKYLEK